MKSHYWHTGTGAILPTAGRKEQAGIATQNRMALMTLVSGIGLASLLALLIGWSMLSITSDFKSTAMLKARNHEVIATLNRLQTHLTEAEKGERGYIVGSEIAATAYLRAVEEARWTTDLIHALASSDPYQKERATQLEKLVDAKLDTLHFLVTVRESGSMQSAQLLMSADQDNLETERINAVLQEMESRENMLLNEALRVRDKAQGKLWGMLVLVTFFLFAGAVWQYRRVRRIVEQAARSQDEMRHLANHDALTGLANRRLLQDRLEAQIDHAAREGQSLAVMYMDLDGFKKVNDTIGHDVGDVLLQHVARRLKAAVRVSDTVARIGGDEFIVVVPELHEAGTAAQIAKTLVEAISKPYSINGTTVKVSASIGISLYPHCGASSDELMHVADQALNQAKNSGKNQYRFASNPDGGEKQGVAATMKEADVHLNSSVS